MEPNLKDMDDYNKPLSHAKMKTIVIALLSTLVVYTLLAYAVNTLG